MTNQGHANKATVRHHFTHVNLENFKSDNNSYWKDLEKKVHPYFYVVNNIMTLEYNLVVSNEAENVCKVWFKIYIFKYIREILTHVHNNGCTKN